VASQAAWMRLWHARVGYVLQDAAVEHVLIKGATWAPFLHVPADAPADVDVLVSPRHFARALAALRAAGFSSAMPGVADDEVALHSTVLRAPGGPEVDVHRSFPGLDADPSRSWEVLCEGRRSAELGHYPVPVLSDDLQLLLAAAAAARDGAGSIAARRVSGAVAQADWAAVVVQARRMQADGTLRAGLTVAGHSELADLLALGPVPHRFASARSRGELRLEEVLSQPWRRRLRVAMRELWPSAGFLTLTQPGVQRSVARRRHVERVLRQLPGAVAGAAGRRVRRR
jgi:hypothetical protein